MVHAHSTQHRERELRPDPADIVYEQSEKVALRRGHKAIKHMRVLPNGQVSKNTNRLTDRWKFIVTRERNEHFIANAADINNGLGGQSADEFAVEKRDHVNR